MTNPNFMVRNTDPDTSHEAAYKIDATELEALVFDVIKGFPNGCIGDDVLNMLPGHRVDTVSPRYAALIRKGYIIDTGERRLGNARRSQRVMLAVPPGDVVPLARKPKKTLPLVVSSNLDYSKGFDDGFDFLLDAIEKWTDHQHKEIAQPVLGLLDYLMGRETT